MSESSAASAEAPRDPGNSSPAESAGHGSRPERPQQNDSIAEPEPSPDLQEAEEGRLSVIWPPPGESSMDLAPDGPSGEVDFVVVHGLYDDSESRSWPDRNNTSYTIHRYNLKGGPSSRILLFRYEGLGILMAGQSRASIKRLAGGLLDGLVRLREDEDRPIVFLSCDIGGLIVKEALAMAVFGTDPRINIFSYTRALVFIGCPHRSADRADMSNTLSQFLFAAFDPYASPPRPKPSVSAIADLAVTVMEVNRRFIDSKVYIQSHLLSIFARDSHAGGISPAFNLYTGTLGLAYEAQEAEDPGTNEGEDSYPDLLSVLERSKIKLTAPSPKSMFLQRRLVTLASPLNPPRAAQHKNNWVLNLDEYSKWLKAPCPSILYAYSDDEVAGETSEQIFFSLRAAEAQTLPLQNLVLYYSFDAHDARRRTVWSMLATLVAQVVCHDTKFLDIYDKLLRNYHLDRGHAWTEAGLLTWLDSFRHSFAITLSLVISGLDACPEAERVLLLGYLRSLARDEDCAWKVAITSRKEGRVEPDTSGWPAAYVVEDPTAGQEKVLLRGLSNSDDKAQLSALSGLSPLAREIVLGQLSSSGRPGGQQPVLPSIVVNLSDTGCVSLESTMGQILRRIPDQKLVRWILTWLLHAARPLTTWELATVCYVNSEHDEGGESTGPGLDFVRGFIALLECFAGIIEIRNDEVRIRHPSFREVFMQPTAANGTSDECLWRGISDAAHFDMTELCFQYLSRPSVNERLEDSCDYLDSGDLGGLDPASRDDLGAYAAQFWTEHFSRIHDRDRQEELLSIYTDTALESWWPKAYWGLLNPGIRPEGPSETLYQVMKKLRLRRRQAQGVVRGTSPDEDLVWAARSGRPAAEMKDILAEKGWTSSAALRALEAAIGMGGDEDLLLSMIETIFRMDDEGPTWQGGLIYRAVWLGYDRMLSRLVELGCATDAGDQPPPLWLAVNFGTTSAADILLRRDPGVHPSTWALLHAAATRRDPGMAELLWKTHSHHAKTPDVNDYTPLTLACQLGNHRTVKALLKLGAETDAAPGSPPLAMAATYGRRKCVDLLLQAGADPNIPDANNTPLRLAALNGHADICRTLVQGGADPNHELNQPPILAEISDIAEYLTTERAVEMIDLLVDLGANLDAGDRWGVTALAHAVRDGHEKIAGRLLELGADPNVVDEDNESPLWIAARDGKTDIVRLLLDNHADPDCRSLTTENCITVAQDNYIIVRLLLESGADVNAFGKNHATPLMIAAEFGYKATAKLLIESKAKVDTVVNFEVWKGVSAVTLSASNGHGDILELLAEAGAPLDQPDQAGWLPIHWAAYTKDDSSLRALIAYQSQFDIEHRSDTGSRALHVVDFEKEPLAKIKMLIRAGADVNAATYDGSTPLAYAAQANHLAATAFLLEQPGIQVNIMSDYYGSALHRAARRGHLDMVKLLVENRADVNLKMEGVRCGTPLQAACLRSGEGDNFGDEVLEMLTFLCMEGAEVNAEAGELGSPLAAAAFQLPPSVSSFLLSNGAKTDVRGFGGRMPVHLAAAHGGENFRLIVEATASKEWLTARDSIGCTPLHWAAQHGRVGTVEEILSASENPDNDRGGRVEEAEMDDSDDKEVMDSIMKTTDVDEGDKTADTAGTVETTDTNSGMETTDADNGVNSADKDGWTPLCYAARGPESYLEPYEAGEVSSQQGVIRLLLQRGADRFVECRFVGDDRKWSPVMIARYSGADQGVIKLLRDGVDGDGASGSSELEDGSLGLETPDLELEEGSPESERREPESERGGAEREMAAPVSEQDSAALKSILDDSITKPGLHRVGYACDHCFWELRGFMYSCTKCVDYCLCSKCYFHRELIHNTEHKFEQEGPEFEATPPAEFEDGEGPAAEAETVSFGSDELEMPTDSDSDSMDSE